MEQNDGCDGAAFCSSLIGLSFIFETHRWFRDMFRETFLQMPFDSSLVELLAQFYVDLSARQGRKCSRKEIGKLSSNIEFLAKIFEGW